MATLRRPTISGAVAACLFGVAAATGLVPTAAGPAGATDATSVAAGGCPLTWPALHAGPPTDTFDGNVSVLVGGDLTVTGGAAGAEGVVVVRGDASFGLDAAGTYEVGVTAEGSQVTPYAGSDMLTVGGTLTAASGTALDVGRGLGGDVVVGALASGEPLGLNGGRLDVGFPDAVAPYGALLDELPTASAAYAALPVTGTVEVTDTTVTLTGDGASDPQVFSVDGAALGQPGGAGRSLSLAGIPTTASVVVNLTGPAAALDVSGVVADGAVLDPFADTGFAALATRLLWNVPAAATVAVGGSGQLPGTLLVPTAGSTTTLAGPGTNGRVLTAGDLVQTGTGRLHSYPFLPDPALTCAGELPHLGTLSLDVELQDPDDVVDPDRVFQGRFSCTLDGTDVTPGDGTWQVRAPVDAKVLSDQLPVGAVCTVTEQLQAPPAPGYEWAEADPDPQRVKVAKREPRSVTLTNRARAVPGPPPVTISAAPGPPPAPAPTPEPPPAVPPTPVPTTVGPSVVPEPVPQPTVPAEPAPPTAAPQAAPPVEPPRTPGGPSPLATTAPLTLRGTFVWAPLLLLSVLTLLVRTRRRPRRQD